MAGIAEIDRYIIDKVRERRQELDISQEYLSFLLGKSEGYISQFESHKRGKHYSTRMLNELAKVLQCSPKDFMPQIPFNMDEKEMQLQVPLTGPTGEVATVNIIKYDKDPMGEPKYHIWKIYFPGKVITVNQDYSIDPGDPLPEWHQVIAAKMKELDKDDF